MSQMAARVEAIFIAPEAGDEMQKVKCARAIEGKGLEGDRYAQGKGTFSKTKRKTVRHVSLISLEAIGAANAELPEEERFAPAATRRNIVVSGIDLNRLVGKRFFVGDVLMRGVELCTPCQRPAKLAGKTDFRNAFEGRGGLRAEIITPGNICVDDPITMQERKEAKE